MSNPLWSYIANLETAVRVSDGDDTNSSAALVLHHDLERIAKALELLTACFALAGAPECNYNLGIDHIRVSHRELFGEEA